MIEDVVNLGNVNPSGHGMNGNVFDSDGISPTLTTNKGEGIKVKVDSDVTIFDDYNRRVKSDQSCIGTVMPNFGNNALGNGTKLIEKDDAPKYRVRKLTQKECWRLMGFSDQDFERAKSAMNQNFYGGNDRSGSQLYKQAGNSIVVDVLCAIMGELYQAMPYLFDDMAIGSFFSGIGAFEKALSTFDSSISNTFNSPCDDPELNQLGYINDYNGDANRVYDGSTIARALKAEAGGAEQRPDGINSLQPVILDVKQQHREGKPRVYAKGITPTLNARDYKDPLRVAICEANFERSDASEHYEEDSP